MNGKCIAVRICGAVVLLLCAASGSSAQQPPNRSHGVSQDVPQTPVAGVSELARENNERVAASAAQIKAVIANDPGMLVLLKRWVAKDATDNGQVLKDEDLADQAVFERLSTDIAFRSVATQIVQRYGYLMPGVNPDSAMGREQELILKERARRLVQIEAEEDADFSKSMKERKAAESEASCEAGADCAAPPLAQPGKAGPPLSEPPPPIQTTTEIPGTPAYRDPQIMTANSNPSNTPNSPFDAGMYGLTSFKTVSAPGQNSGPDPIQNELFSPSAAGANLSGAQRETPLPADFGMANAKAPELNTIPAAATTGALSNTSMMAGHWRNREADRAAMVHLSNPYTDIPSLYDLYVQAPSRNGSPQRFGESVFRDGLRDPRTIPIDLPVGPDYVVGPGDSLSIDLWGGVSTRLVRIVDRQGRVTLPEAGPVQVSGRSLGEVQSAVQRAFSSQFRDTSAEVSIARLRTVRVYVVGEVAEAGAYDISSLSTALNALIAAGGVTPRGSLRELKHYRGKQLVEKIDAYSLLLSGVMPDATKFENGDTLMVPPVGPLVTITGMVRRPAIYELQSEKTLSDALDLAGGILPAAALKHVEVQRLEAHEKRTMLSLNLSENPDTAPQLATFHVQDGDEIHIFPIAPYNQDAIYLQGHVLRPGRYSFHDGMKLTDIIASYKDLLPEPAPHYAEIIRLDAPDFRPNVVSFDLASAMENPETAPKLEPLDTVRIFSRFDFEPAPWVWVGGEVRAPGRYTTAGQAHLRDAVYLAGGLAPDADTGTAQLYRVNGDGTSKIFSVNLEEALKGSAADNVLLQPRDRLLIHKNRLSVETPTVEVTGEVAKPGRYPFTENMRAEDLIRSAGGLKRSADTDTADLTRYAASAGGAERLQISLASLANGNATEDVPLKAGDVLAIRQIPGWKDVGASVRIKGEVNHPSTYGIQPGERLSSVLDRAGGYTAEAYPYGAVLMRREVRELQQQNQTELINRIKAEKVQLKALPDGDQDQRNAKQNALAQTDTTLAQLSSNPPIGRVVIHIQSDISTWKNTPADVVLRDGDELLIPKKATVVMVNGQVFNPTAINAQAGRSAKWYLSQAGGLTPIADKKGVFVIRADGSVIASKSNSNSLWIGDPMGATLRAGDTVVVPEKTPKIGGVNWTTIMQTAQMASSVALAVAYIHP
ncbi:MAG TPA: SLBB domain-containing protein [Dongiaceae bacterium]|nr:SLBB domain-containing protein [Dongiaceae bacterium]